MLHDGAAANDLVVAREVEAPADGDAATVKELATDARDGRVVRERDHDHVPKDLLVHRLLRGQQHERALLRAHLKGIREVLDLQRDPLLHELRVRLRDACTRGVHSVHL